MKKTALFFLMMFAFFSCSEKTIVEEVVAKHEDGSRKEVRYHEVNKDGSKTCVRETWYYEEGMKYLDGPIVDGKRNGTFEIICIITATMLGKLISIFKVTFTFCTII